MGLKSKSNIRSAALLSSAFPIVWVSSMVIHDISPKGTFRSLLSNVLDDVFEYWPLIVLLGVVGFILSVVSFVYTRKAIPLIIGVIALLVAGFMYSIITGISRSGI